MKLKPGKVQNQSVAENQLSHVHTLAEIMDTKGPRQTGTSTRTHFQSETRRKINGLKSVDSRATCAAFARRNTMRSSIRDFIHKLAPLSGCHAPTPPIKIVWSHVEFLVDALLSTGLASPATTRCASDIYHPYMWRGRTCLCLSVCLSVCQ